MSEKIVNKRRPQGLYGENLINWVYENRTELHEESGCRLWTGPMGTMYRPMISYGDQRNFVIARLFWEFINGKIPEGMLVGHTCESTSPDHYKCINTNHLALQTPSENMAEKIKSHIERGITAYIGANVPYAKHMPQNLSHDKKVTWLLENRTSPVEWTDRNGETWNCMEWVGSTRNRPNSNNDNGMHCISFSSNDSGQQKISTLDRISRTVSISRYVLFVLNKIDYLDPINKSIVCRHKCGNGICINPEHLETGTQRENILDMRAYSKNTKISEEIVHEIMKDLIERYTKGEITTKTAFNILWQEKLTNSPYNIKVSSHTINNLVWRRTAWKDITEPYMEELSKVSPSVITNFDKK